MSLTLILLLIALGLLLILIEVFVIPGTTIVGIAGAGLIIFSIFEAYKILGTHQGHVIVAVTLLSIGTLFFIAFKSGTWKRVMLSTNIDGKVNLIEVDKVHVGDTGKAISRIAPAGTARFNNELFEVHTTGDFIDQESELIVSKIEDNKIFVKRK